jgi:hypothetical protein
MLQKIFSQETLPLNSKLREKKGRSILIFNCLFEKNVKSVTLATGYRIKPRFENVAKFKYLETILNKHDIHVEIKRRLNSGHPCYHSINIFSCLI